MPEDGIKLSTAVCQKVCNPPTDTVISTSSRSFLSVTTRHVRARSVPIQDFMPLNSGNSQTLNEHARAKRVRYGAGQTMKPIIFRLKGQKSRNLLR